ncbi:MAG: response regulator [Proteobacteria bacterium]|nr:response regulator [Pseudomonadota bacterium]
MVEDEIAVANELSQFLIRRGYQVTPAGDGNEAMAQLATGSFDLIITDIRMPGLDGRGLIEKLETNAASPPIIVVTGQIDYEPGANGAAPPTVLRKPVSLRELDRTILVMLHDPESEGDEDEH